MGDWVVKEIKGELRGKEEGAKLVVQEAKLKKTQVPEHSIYVAPAAYCQNKHVGKERPLQSL